jgi:phospholipid/cholesterol/gamma-HCH transport system substrate-binding protein
LSRRKEIITGLATIAAIALLITGVNFLKGNSFFGGDQIYYAYFPNSAGVTPATSVYVNGVDVGKVLEVDLTGSKDSLQRVLIKFNITDDELRIVKNSIIEAGGIDMFTKGLTIRMNPDLTAGYYAEESKIQGVVTVDMISQVKAYADPLTQKVQGMMSSIDKMVTAVTAFWDTTATSQIEESMKEVKIAIKKFGNAANEIETMLVDERIRFSRIMSNVEAITANIKKSNDTVKAIVGNVKHITDDLVTSEFKQAISNATQTLATMNQTLEAANRGEGTLGKLLGDDELYKQLVQTNKDLQNLVNDLTVHPERYIHFSVIGAKTKGVPLTNKEEHKLKKFLDSLPDN